MKVGSYFRAISGQGEKASKVYIPPKFGNIYESNARVTLLESRAYAVAATTRPIL